MYVYVLLCSIGTIDAESNSKMLKMLLSKIGVSSFTAENGQVAVDMVLQDKDLFDVVFMDNQMPVMVVISSNSMTYVHCIALHSSTLHNYIHITTICYLIK